jgi:hypothetical protein
MDQVHSLINRLTRQVAANVHSAELLSTIEMLRQEIMKAGLPQLKQGQSVCVWMPSTLASSKPTATPISFSNGSDFQPMTEEIVAPVVEIASPEPVALKKEEPFVMPAVPRQVYSAPTPPPAVVAEKTSVPVADRQEFLLKSELSEEEIAEEAAYMPKPARPVPAPVENFPAPEVNHAYIKVQELAAANHARISGTDVKPFSKFAGIETVVKERFPVAPAPAPKKEINELVVDPAIPLNQKLKTEQAELADVLAAPRIGDLKKAFGINERFQFINSLFRGDDDMFDRSIRTLNNFGNYQEASFWMQRELVIKMGWNEEDELVKQFYNILARRF